MMKELFLHPFFLFGALVRIAMIALFLPAPEANWYLPFMDVTSIPITHDPWGTFMAKGGSPLAFPYGYVMWLAFMPLTMVCKLFGLPLHYGYQLTLMAADIGLLYMLRLMLPNVRSSLLLATYWFSPIILFATYYMGMNDLIPVLLLVAALYFTRKLHFIKAGLLCGAAASAKLSMGLAVPFFIIYLVRNNAMRKFFDKYLAGLVFAFVLFGVAFLMSHSALFMLFNNPEMNKPYQFNFHLGENIVIYILPMAYLLMLYMAWRIKRLNFELFSIFLGMVFLSVVLLTSAASGWFVWTVPFLVMYQVMSDKKAVMLTALFSLLYVAINIDVTNLLHINGNKFQLLPTFLEAVGIVLGLRIWQEAMSKNDYFRLSRKPFAIGIAGDSGAGKNTYADALEDLFGRHSVVHVSGDDYHLWDRHNPMWQYMTHLNPLTNNLENFAGDVLRLFKGKPIFARHYDHDTGKISLPRLIKSNYFIIASGLHALYIPRLRDYYTIKIYLDIDEDLRRYLKIKRDVKKRGHSVETVLKSMEKREPDAIKFIRSQIDYADLLLKLEPLSPDMLKQSDDAEPLRLKLIVKSRGGFNEISLMRALVGLSSVQVDVMVNDKQSETIMIIDGDISAEEIEIIARMVVPRIFDFLDTEPKWQDGSLGLMQLVTLSHIDQILNRHLL